MTEELNQVISRAQNFETNGKIDAAIYFYTVNILEAAEHIINGVKENKLSAGFRNQAEGLILKAEELKQKQSQENLRGPSKSKVQLDTERAEFLLYQALDLDEDEDGDDEEAIELYSEAIQLCLEARKGTDRADLQTQLKVLAENGLERAEALKQKMNDKKTTGEIERLTEETTTIQLNNRSPRPKRNNRKQSVNSSAFTKEELKISGESIQLRIPSFTIHISLILDCSSARSTSQINGREYVPFMSVDLNERFAFPVQYSDRDGLLVLAGKQRTKLKQWVRPEDFLRQPTVIDKVDSGTIKQTVVSDCSFVASLAIAARYERRTGKKLVTSLIYPQNRRGDPVYNPCGKYMIQFHLNGIQRKVIIDDQLPMGHHGELLCSYSQNRNELWVSLLEKAYMKVMGGYDFPGSNSNIDLHALTGWIPERTAIRPGTDEFDPGKTFEKIFRQYHAGNILVTVATGKLSQDECDRAGLVDCHAYAMLDVRKVGDRRLFLVKNPWNHLRWKGKYSAKDKASWTPELRKALGYNPEDAGQFDDGVFWIDLDSLCHFFDVIYINWTPTLFPHTYAIHSLWSSGSGPTKDLYSMSANPQYSLELLSATTTEPEDVWIHLTRHITDKADFADNKEYITVLVYKNDGKKVYYPFDPKPYIDGTRINSPHYLCKMRLERGAPRRYTLVVAQYEKTSTIYYTLRVYSAVEFRMRKIVDNFRHHKQLTGEWKGSGAGGCANFPSTYKNNPMYQINLTEESNANTMVIELKGPKQYSVGYSLVQISSKFGQSFAQKSSGAYRPGYCVLRLENVPAGVYNLTPTTFQPGQEGPFILNIDSDGAFKCHLMSK